MLEFQPKEGDLFGYSIKKVLRQVGGYIWGLENHFPFCGSDIPCNIIKRYSFCVYRTVYLGESENIPKYYIGSTSIKKVCNGYFGSVRSKVWSGLFKELIQKGELRVDILLLYKVRERTLEAEKMLQELLKVIKSKDYFNMAIAVPNGFCGMDVSGTNNPMYGVSYTAWNKGLIGWLKHTDKSKKKTSESLRKFHRENPEASGKRSQPMLGKNRKMYTDGINVWDGREEIQKHLGYKSLFTAKRLIKEGHIYVI